MKRPVILIFAFYLIPLAGCYKTAVVNRPLPNVPYSAGDTASVANSQKAITSFIIKAADNPGLMADVVGATTFDSISLIFVQGTDISNLVPTITILGKSISPASMIPQNFDSTLVYTVTATDGSKFGWHVVSSFR